MWKRKKVEKRKVYIINTDNISTIEDVKLIFKNLDMTFVPESEEHYQELKHLLRESL